MHVLSEQQMKTLQSLASSDDLAMVDQVILDELMALGLIITRPDGNLDLTDDAEAILARQSQQRA